jgi:hypothetical protein
MAVLHFVLLLAFSLILLSKAAEENNDKLKLVYFDGKGRAEISRIMLHGANKDFEDLRAGRDFVWSEVKTSGAYAANLDRLPVLVIENEGDSTTIGQSKAIEYYIADTYGYMGSTKIDAATVMMIVEHCTDLKQAFKDAKTAGNAEAFMTSAEDKMFKHWLYRIEKSLPAPMNGPTWADISLYQMLKYSFNEYAELVNESLAEMPHPKIEHVLSSVAEFLTEYNSDPRYSQGEF